MTIHKNIFYIFCGAFIVGLALVQGPLRAEHRGKNPLVHTAPDGSRNLVLPEDVAKFLDKECPGYRIPKETEYNPDMLTYYHSRLVGIHPAVAWGDFNGDKKRDYALLIITSDTKWGPLCELVVLNGVRGGFESYRLGEIYNYKDDYVSFSDGKLYKGRYKKNGWYINWDPKKTTYVTLKS